MEATNAIVNAIETINATVDQLVQQGNELCDDVDNLRAADERMNNDLAAIRSNVEAIRADLDHDIVNIGIDIGKHNAAIAAQASSIAADKEHISANKEAIASQAKDLADIRAAVADIRSGLANDVVNLQAIVEAQAKEIADLRAIVSAMHATIGATVEVQGKVIEAIGDVVAPAQTDATQTDATQTDAAPAQPTDMAALIARIPKPDAVRTRAAQKDAPVEAPAPVVEAPATRKEAAKPAPRAQATTNAVETRAYARQYMIENGAKVEQLRDPAAIEATVASDAFAAWLAER